MFCRISNFLNLDVQDFDPLQSTIVISLFRSCLIGSDEFGWDYMTGKSASPTLMPLHKSIQCWLSLCEIYCFMEWDCSSVIYIFYVSKEYLYFIVNIFLYFYAFRGFLYFYYWYFPSSSNKIGIFIENAFWYSWYQCVWCFHQSQLIVNIMTVLFCLIFYF